jgi:hypothetical protein
MNFKAISNTLDRFSPPDLVFIPLVSLMIVALVYAALAWRPLGAEPVVTETEFNMSGRALAQMIPGPGTTLQLLANYGDRPVVRLSANATFEAAGNLSAGVGAAISSEFEARVATRMVRVEAELRAAPDLGTEAAKLGYFTVGHGDSGWRDIEVTDRWETVGFCFQTSATTEANNNEAVGVWPDVSGAGRALLLREIRVIIEPEGETIETCEANIGAPT